MWRPRAWQIRPVQPYATWFGPDGTGLATNFLSRYHDR